MARRRAWGLGFAILAGAEGTRFTEARRVLDVLLNAHSANENWAAGRDLGMYAAEVLRWRQSGAPSDLGRMRTHVNTLLNWRLRPFAAFGLLDVAEMAAETSNARVAAEAAEGLRDLAAELDRRLYWGLAAIASSRAAATAGGELVSAATSAEEAVGRLDGLGYPLFLGRALDALGRALVRRDRARARGALERAVDIFAGCGAVWRRDRSGEVLRRIGGSSRVPTLRRPSPGADALSPREREVARLAAQGHTAPEIARELFVGERTIESHLGRIYAKLGIASKLELVQRAAALGLAE